VEKKNGYKDERWVTKERPQPEQKLASCPFSSFIRFSPQLEQKATDEEEDEDDEDDEDNDDDDDEEDLVSVVVVVVVSLMIF
jgi:hypothetical protein